MPNKENSLRVNNSRSIDVCIEHRPFYFGLVKSKDSTVVAFQSGVLGPEEDPVMDPVWSQAKTADQLLPSLFSFSLKFCHRKCDYYVHVAYCSNPISFEILLLDGAVDSLF